MLNKNKPFWKVRVTPDHILEIHLNQETWEKIVRIADLKKKSYSWVVRYCVFRLLKRQMGEGFGQQGCSGRAGEKFEELSERAKQHIYAGNNKVEDLHRHKLCLYGRDEFFIRLTSGRLNFTMSHLVRLALEWNLDELERLSLGRVSRFHRLAFYWLGIKLYRDVDLPIISPPHKNIHLRHFPDSEYW
ncbi:MAG: hypothetical protein ABUK01_03385 [Leptospirales bacterium]